MGGTGLFSPLAISGFRARNRAVRSATSMRMAGPKGEVTDELLGVHRRLSQGMVGIDITGHAFVSPDGRARKGQLGAWSDDFIPGLSRLSQVIVKGGAIPILQISHAGMLSEPLYGDKVAPSPGPGVKGLSKGDIDRIVESFVWASVRAYKSGFYGIQLHAAHGYLLSQFLSPRVNKRQDEFSPPWGGVEIIRRIVRGIREEVSGDFLVSLKMGPDCREGGLSSQLFVSVVKELSRDIDFIEVSRGVCRYEEIVKKGVLPGSGEAYNLDAAISVSDNPNGLKVFLVGGLRSFEVSSGVLERGVDAVCYSRPLIREPELIKRWMDGDTSPSTCISCNRCALEKGPVMCHSGGGRL